MLQDGPRISRAGESSRPSATEQIIRYSYYGGLPWLRDVCRELGYGFRHVRDADPETAREWIRAAACVISSGRGALEAMACGRPTIICDDRPYNGGALAAWATFESAATNYSGRGGKTPSPRLVEMMIGEMVTADEWADPREYVIEHHAAPMIVDQLLVAAGVEVACAPA